MSSGAVTPTREEFVAMAPGRRVIAVTRRIMADAETPVGLYRKLAQDRPGTFLLESAEHGGVWSRYSIVGVRSHGVLTERAGRAVWTGGEPPVGIPTDGEPLEVLAETLRVLHTPREPGLPPLSSGLVGFVSYDAVRRWERLPDGNPDELAVPEIGLMLATDLAVLDHSDGSVLLIANAVNFDDTDKRVTDAWSDAVKRLEVMVDDLGASAPATAAVVDEVEPDVVSRTERPEFLSAVERAKESIASGEAFQIVVSQRFEVRCDADALDVYRVLRATNPSPYMYLLRYEDFDIVGSSPEALVKVADGRVLAHPIAGTRWRGETPEADAALAAELLEDDKERAEHLMLVDLARNDLGRVCRPGTVEVVDFMSIERYSHVMHIVSTVVGELDRQRSAYDVLAATFPAGTLSGAPKVRAMELIDELEPTRRGLYGGTVGYFDFAGDMDMAIAIRTGLVRGGRMYVQAGGGIVADSDPASEFTESVNKASAVLRAVATAETLRAP